MSDYSPTPAQPVELHVDGAAYPQPVEGRGFMASCAIAVADTTAADTAVFAITARPGTAKNIYIKALYGSLIFNGTATATGKNGIYFERFEANTALPSGGTAITLVNRDGWGGGMSEVADCRFHTGALTVTGLVYEAAKFGRYTIPISATGAGLPFYVPFGNKGLALPPGDGLALRLTYQAVVGLFIDLNVLGVVA